MGEYKYTNTNSYLYPPTNFTLQLMSWSIFVPFFYCLYSPPNFDPILNDSRHDFDLAIAWLRDALVNQGKLFFFFFLNWDIPEELWGVLFYQCYIMN